ncbi:hypothetical protein DAEQUDRAFT_809028 [Daedalea quercina L-15889]|uniref:Uncharacterized protein n=1 Tax=Daedalea quercina L-15889 TaxID=1314783 RepID=A0A165SWA7_9APHY|nr:hypothetical protein DAEQUDRAFT_809028 [Daedalea quercina L-15889]
MPAPVKAPPPNTKPTPTPDAKAQAQKKQPPLPAPQSIKQKKEADQDTKAALESDTKKQISPKNLPRRSSKPFINWFQRKLAGTVRARRVSDPDSVPPVASRTSVRSSSLREKPRRASAPQRPAGPPLAVRMRSKTESKHGRKISTVSSIPSRKPASLDGLSAAGSSAGLTESDDGRRSSLARSSLWSPTSHLEADEDASMRPLPPTSPPSPSPSHSSSSYMSDPRTFRSMTASTKPTTLLSVDLTGGMAHIAQAPPTPTTPSRLQAHLRSQSAGPNSAGVTFSAIRPTSPSRPSSSASTSTPSPSSGQYALHAPQHTAHHPRNNPRPSSPPQDDASVLTLASSAFAMPGARIGMTALAFSGGTSVADDSVSHLSHGVGAGGDSTSHFHLGELDDERDLMEKEYQDVDASVRALRPRSSRRGSWESQASKWSASASLALTGMTSHSPVSHAAPRSLWTNWSYRTGGVSVDHGDVSVSNDHEEETDENGEETEGEATSLDERASVPEVHSLSTSVLEIRSGSTRTAADDVSGISSLVSPVSTDDASTPPATPIDLLAQAADAPSTEPTEPMEPSKSTMATPKPGPIALQAHDAMPDIAATIRSLGAVKDQEEHPAHDGASVTTLDYETDNFETPMSTPLPQPE